MGRVGRAVLLEICHYLNSVTAVTNSKTEALVNLSGDTSGTDALCFGVSAARIRCTSLATGVEAVVHWSRKQSKC